MMHGKSNFYISLTHLAYPEWVEIYFGAGGNNEHHQESRIKNQESRIKNQESRIKNQESL